MKWVRGSLRLQNYDYSQCGAYFITICTQNGECLFGEIKNGEMRLNDVGGIAEQCWIEIPHHFNGVSVDYGIIMPNHMHGIIIIQNPYPDPGRGTACRAPTMEQFGNPTIGSVPTIMRSFKSAVTNHINQLRNTPGQPLWQRNYYEHIIRNENDFNQIREYIHNNPLKWELDEYYIS